MQGGQGRQEGSQGPTMVSDINHTCNMYCDFNTTKVQFFYLSHFRLSEQPMKLIPNTYPPRPHRGISQSMQLEEHAESCMGDVLGGDWEERSSLAFTFP